MIAVSASRRNRIRLTDDSGVLLFAPFVKFVASLQPFLPRISRWAPGALKDSKLIGFEFAEYAADPDLGFKLNRYLCFVRGKPDFELASLLKQPSH